MGRKHSLIFAADFVDPLLCLREVMEGEFITISSGIFARFGGLKARWMTAHVEEDRTIGFEVKKVRRGVGYTRPTTVGVVHALLQLNCQIGDRPHELGPRPRTLS